MPVKQIAETKTVPFPSIPKLIVYGEDVKNANGILPSMIIFVKFIGWPIWFPSVIIPEVQLLTVQLHAEPTVQP